MRIAVVLLLTGCLAESTTLETFEVQPTLPGPVDLLVVLDDTTAMAPVVFPNTPPTSQIGVLSLMYNGAPDIRIAVTTTTTGTLRTSPAVPSGYIVHRLNFEDGQMETNYSGELGTAIASLTNVGHASTAPNAALASTEAALGAGWVRDSTGVGIFMVTASDDQSSGTTATYASAVLAPGNNTVVSVVNATAVPRLADFASAFPISKFMAADAWNMSGIEIFGALFGSSADTYCFPVTAAEVTAGQFDCEMYTSYNMVVHPLATCTGDPWQSATPCWQLLADPSCPSGRGLLFGGPYHYYHPRLIGRCAVAN